MVALTFGLTVRSLLRQTIEWAREQRAADEAKVGAAELDAIRTRIEEVNGRVNKLNAALGARAGRRG